MLGARRHVLDLVRVRVLGMECQLAGAEPGEGLNDWGQKAGTGPGESPAHYGPSPPQPA